MRPPWPGLACSSRGLDGAKVCYGREYDASAVRPAMSPRIRAKRPRAGLLAGLLRGYWGSLASHSRPPVAPATSTSLQCGTRQPRPVASTTSTYIRVRSRPAAQAHATAPLSAASPKPEGPAPSSGKTKTGLSEKKSLSMDGVGLRIQRIEARTSCEQLRCPLRSEIALHCPRAAASGRPL